MRQTPLYWLTSVAIIVGFFGIATRREALAKTHEHSSQTSQKEKLKLALAQPSPNGQTCAQLSPGSICYILVFVLRKTLQFLHGPM